MFHINKRHFPKRAECTVVLSSYVLLSITLDSTDSRHMKRSHWPALSRTGPVVPQLQPGTPWVVDSPRPLCPVCVKGLDASPRSHFLPMAAIFIARVHSLQLHTCVGDFFFFSDLRLLFLFLKFLTVFVVCTSLHTVWAHCNSSKSQEDLRSSKRSGHSIEISKLKVEIPKVRKLTVLRF